MGKPKYKQKRTPPQGTIKNLPKSNSLSRDNESGLHEDTDEKCTLKNRIIAFLSSPRVALTISIISIVLTFISIIQWFVPNKEPSSTATAMRYYESGLILLEDDDLEEAEKSFATAYNIDNNLLDF